MSLSLAQAAPPDEALNRVKSVWDFVIAGGPIMIPIGLLSLLALAVTIERLITLGRRRVIPPAFLPGLRGVESDLPRALEYCRADGSPLATLVAAALKKRGESRPAVEKAVEEAGQRLLTRFRERMRLMSALPQISTMLGLLGTIFGMIKTFQAVAASGQSLGKTEMLAEGIFEAWTATAAGLLVAIPALAAYHILMGRIDSTMVALDEALSGWLEEGAKPSPAAAATAAPPIKPEPMGGEAATAVVATA